MSDQDYRSDLAQWERAVQEALAEALTDGLIRWNGHFRAGKPLFSTTDLGRELQEIPATVGADTANTQSTDDCLDGWEGDVDALELITPDLAADPGGCDRTFASKCEAFTTGLVLGARGLSEDNRLRSPWP